MPLQSHEHDRVQDNRSARAPHSSAPARRRVGGDGGFTIMETLIAAVVLIIGVMGLFALLDESVKTVVATRSREGATSLARGILEDAHTISYAQLSPSAIESQLKAMPSLSDASGEAGWQIVRGGVTYTVTASECSIDDPKDGYGTHDGTFCSDSSTEYSGAGTLDSQPADLKRVTVEVKWKAKGRTPVVRQVATFTAAGEATGLTASNLQLAFPKLEHPAAPVIEVAAFTELTFSVTAPASATRVDWAIDGARQSTSAAREAGSETSWQFTWPIAGLSDGAYQISAQAVNASGVIGPPITITVTLIRGTPAAPKGLIAGYNTIYLAGKPKLVVELEWQANSERNVLGYRTYKPIKSSPFKQLTCPPSPSELSLSRSCIDLEPPKPTEKNLTYEVAALYRPGTGGQKLNEEEVKEGPSSSVTVIGGEPLPAGPNQPLNLAATKNADGSVTLTWESPTSGPTVSFYRIYRGSTDYTSRYGITGSGSSTTFTDAEASTTHEYWVTAVGEHLTESSFSNKAIG
jgi:Tfp pilus assembly protein PilV